MFIENLKIFFTKVLDLPFWIQIISMSLCITYIFFRFDKKKNIWIQLLDFWLRFVASLSFFIVINALLFGLSGHFRFLAGINFPISVILSFICTTFLYPSIGIEKRALYSIFFFTISILTLEIGGLIGMVSVVDASSSTISIVSKSVCMILVCFITFLVKKFSILDAKHIMSEIVFNLIINITCSLVLMVYLYLKTHNSEMVTTTSESAIYITVFLALYNISLFSYFITYRLINKAEENKTLIIEKQRKYADDRLAQFSNDNLEEIRETKHEIKNQLFCISALLQENKTEQAIDMINQITGKFTYNALTRDDYGNTLINAITNMAKMKAQKSKTKINFDIVVPKEFVGFKRRDITSLLTNLLDNAIEECERNNEENQVIECSVIMQENSLLVSIINPTKKKTISRISDSEKVDKNRHGYGRKIVKKIVGEYDGYYEEKIENNSYLTQLVINKKDI